MTSRALDCFISAMMWLDCILTPKLVERNEITLLWQELTKEVSEP